ncbi:tol-pal system-associated acyl-CoA thioesterase [Schauerella aestuarii]|uniref:tol-pal system-associated acyl-CoA thioesterase n=1 Tax=Schauerella aestuarii TaxID=2511204 RepID=UPI00136DA6EC|nr:tol-pal system-associated acyl-CoA thioesterase [Achromobacter aestuarii]MYZ41499.1 tol-pal system-associated acyl-CoA thioesterase [Achromobacter aestuarii]
MPTEMPAEALFDIRVYYEDTDAGGVVYYANYLKFLERARTEWLRELGVFQSELRAATQRIFVVNALDMAYRKPARLDDRLTIHSRITRLGRASIHFAQAARRDGELLAEGTIQVCCVDAASLRPAEIPPEVLSILKSIQE